MNEWIAAYVFKITVCALVTAVAETVIPDGAIKRAAGFAFGLLMTLVICLPPAGLSIKTVLPEAGTEVNEAVIENAISAFTEGFPGYSGARADITVKNGAVTEMRIDTAGCEAILAPERESAKQTLKETLAVLYRVDKNMIFIEQGG